MWKFLIQINKKLIIAIPIMMVGGFLFGVIVDAAFVKQLKSLIMPFTFLMVYPMMVTLNIKSVFKGEDFKLQMTTQIINFLLIPVLAYYTGRLFFAGGPEKFGLWAVGLYVGIRMLMHGWMLMALGRTGQVALTHLQDTRIETLEHQVRAGAMELLETQAILVDHTAMLIVLGDELRQKVSASDVDPAIRELNTDLKSARVELEKAADATHEAWEAVQREASESFQKLRESSAELTGRLKKELGLGAKGDS